MSLDKLVAEACEVYEKQHGRVPRWVVTAPGRVNLIGEHTDYNAGYVFPMAIERYVVMVAGPSFDSADISSGSAHIYSTENGQHAVIQISGEVHPGENVEWSSYVQGVVAGCLKEGLHPEPFHAVIHSDVPLGGGLSSSAALEVSTATLMEEMVGIKLGGVKKALLCQTAEHEYARMPCGIMDQFISALGVKDHLMLLDCRSCTTEMIPLLDERVSILIINSNVKHALSGSEYPERRASCFTAVEKLGVEFLRDVDMETLQRNQGLLTPREYRRARHVVGEISRTVQAAKAIQNRCWEEVGHLMVASHESLRDDYEVSCPEIDRLVELAVSLGVEEGVYGSRITGGGFGGCTVSLVLTEKVEKIMDFIGSKYTEQVGIKPVMFVTRPAQGAHVVR